MTKHSSSQVSHEENTTTSDQKNDFVTPLSIELKARKKIADAKYAPYDVRAKRFDDEQAVFSSTMDNFLEASKMTTKIALILAEREEHTV